MRFLSILALIMMLACCEKSDGKDPATPDSEPEALTAEQISCIRKAFAAQVASGPYEVVTTYRQCGAPDDASIFTAAAQDLFEVKNDGSWHLK